MTPDPKRRFWPEARRFLLGVAALAIVTGLYFWLGLSLVSASFTHLIVIVLLSLVSGLPSLIALSLISVACLNFFFAPPVFSLRIDYPEDILTLAAFLVTSWIISVLIKRVRSEQEAHVLTAEKLRGAQTGIAHAERLATIGQLSASIVHEVRQPISAMMINAQAALRWLEQEPPKVEEARQSIGRIAGDGERANAVIERIRALVRKEPLRKDRLEINGAIREVIELTHGEAVRNGVSVRPELADGLPPVHGDRIQVQQVVLNLVINAIEATAGISEGDRAVFISTGAIETRSAVVTVRDSGPGLTAATLERLFEPFFTTKPNGLGLGLAICRSIVEEHGGQLRATAGTSRGATFEFTLPFWSADPA